MLKVKKLILRLIPYFFILLFSVIFIMPLLWMVGTSLKLPIEVFSHDSGLFPADPQWSNYTAVFKRMKFGTYLRNTIITSVLPVIGQLIAAPMVAYSITRVPWKGGKYIFPLVLFTMMVPGQVTQIPLFSTWSHLGLTNTFWPLILPAFFGSAYYVFLLRQFMLSVPSSLLEAARIDGASEVRALYQIFIPLCKPVLITVGLMTFMGHWNDLMSPLIYLYDGSKYTLAIALQRFLAEAKQEWELLMAAATLFTTPIIVIFFIGQKYFIEGIATTGLK
jgi:multiple sugar transport system permease protein